MLLFRSMLTVNDVAATCGSERFDVTTEQLLMTEAAFVRVESQLHCDGLCSVLPDQVERIAAPARNVAKTKNASGGQQRLQYPNNGHSAALAGVAISAIGAAKVKLNGRLPALVLAPTRSHQTNKPAPKNKKHFPVL